MILTEEKFRKRIVSRLVLIWFNRPHIKYRAIAFLMYPKIQGAICVIITLVMLITAVSLPASTLGAPNDGTNLSKKDLKSLSNCQAKSAKDGDLTQPEVTDCYNQLFPQGTTAPNGQSAPQNNLNPQGTTAPNGKTFPEGVSLPTGLGPREGQGYSTNLPLGPHGEADEKLK
jgi:hypothetical protein